MTNRIAALLPASALALAVLTAAPLLAQSAAPLDPEHLREQFQSGGWDSVQVESDDATVEVEARRGGMELDVTYDRASGMVRDLEIENSDGRPVMIPGLTLTPAA
ncbi:PepSY domain-containing protein [Pararhodobacter marinus]|uniref:PepSY domain-containing protein n=1 Tax=Pararhodobacter marinus TaxID=2184063 RepID=A0A2U2C9C7_9RHOB|nr:PepSY domain-containing protein [Pararhodobacter marinus]PWE28485.1 hypothetical protein C4N9_10835 [Pararhodobacter marinus]